ncbi:MAG: 3'-5' exonuclease [Candidatus Aenigmarchaeota archaeon]|nr:3'-5' exonuclease [Candidatus Aenigmarchaeota archaeon]
MEKNSFIVLDIETTGLSRHMHKITEFAAIKIRWCENYGEFRISDKFSTLINPLTEIPLFITKLTGITNEMVENAPIFSDIAQDIRKFIGDNTIVAHNTTFDYNFLDHNFKKREYNQLYNNALCTCKLSRRVIPHLKSHSLKSMCKYFSINNIQAHRAMSDALATKEVFCKLYDLMKIRKIDTLEEVLKFQKSRIVK